MSKRILCCLGLILLFGGPFACQKKTVAPSSPIPPATSTFTPSSTSNLSSTPGAPTQTPTQSLASFTPTPSTTSTFSSTTSPQSTNTPTVTSTNTSTPSPQNTNTPCQTASPTVTSCMTPTPVYWITGSYSYVGTGPVNGSHPILIGIPPALYSVYTTSSGTYSFAAYGPGVHSLSIYYNSRGVTDPYNRNLQIVPGMRYLSNGSCSFPVSVLTYSVTVTAGVSPATGPSLTLDDSCSYEGVYGNIQYNGTKGAPGLCRRLNIQVYSDSTHTNLLSYFLSFYKNGDPYHFLTNFISSQTGLAPVYLRAWYDADGSNTFNTGDPYLEIGPVSPSDNGTLQNLTFDDTNVK